MSPPGGQYTTISLFSGAGGMDVGIEGAGRFRTLACVEKVPAFAATLEANRDAGLLGSPDTLVLDGDIKDIDPVALAADCGLGTGELDLLTGGPPCQTFSTAGRRATVQDPRGMLLWQFLRYVAELRPKYFLMENVRGLLSAAIRHRPIKDRPDRGGPPLAPDEEPGSVLRLWLDDLMAWTDGAYRVDCFEVNSVNYGAPQIRERVLFFGNRVGDRIDFPAPTHRNQYSRRRPESLLDMDQPSFRTLGDALDSIEEDDGEVLDFSPRKKAYLALVPEGANWRALPEELQRESMGRAWHAKGGRSGWWRRLSRDLPCPTVVTMPNHASTSMCHPTETRALTLRECAAVQEFPLAWRFCGTTAEKYTQVGNALPVRLARVAGELLADHLDRDVATPAGDLPPYRQLYLDSHVRTRQWYRAGVTFTWKDGGDNATAYYAPGRRAAA